MLVIKLKRTKLGTVITTLDPALDTPLEDQRRAISNYATKAPRVLVSGPEVPPKADGVRHVKTTTLPQIKNLLGTYMQTIPGSEICLITNPNALITGDIQAILAHVDSIRLDIAWACNINAAGRPIAFILSSPVVAHLMNDLPQGMTFKHDWQAWTHGWMGRLLRQRYFDGTQFGLLTLAAPYVPHGGQEVKAQAEKAITDDILNAYSIPEPKVEAPKPKRGNIRKIKIAQP